MFGTMFDIFIPNIYQYICKYIPKISSVCGKIENLHESSKEYERDICLAGMEIVEEEVFNIKLENVQL